MNEPRADEARRRDRVVALLWLLVVLELISPFPLALTFGTAWILIARPAWFRRLVDVLYDDPIERST